MTKNNFSLQAENIATQSPNGPSVQVLQELMQSAKEASAFSYSPYSHFPVGAAVLTDSGRVFRGCNVENASYGLTNCAERTAIFTAAAAGERQLSGVAIYTPTDQPAAPCGACRQVIYEFGPDCFVVSVCDGDQYLFMNIRELIPHAFGPNDLEEASPEQNPLKDEQK